MRDAFSSDLATAAIGVLDSGFMLFYQQVRSNTRRIVHLAIAFLPLMALLVGSCKTSLTPTLAGSAYESAEKFQDTLFPDRAGFHGVNYTPAAGYVAQARSLVEEQPHTMLLLTRREIGYVFGKPSLRRRDADAEVWQYSTDACVVNFYFYGNKPMSFADIRLKDGTKLVAERPSMSEQSKCLRDIDAEKIDSGVSI